MSLTTSGWLATTVPNMKESAKAAKPICWHVRKPGCRSIAARGFRGGERENRMRSYAIGDIHGHLDKLEQAHALIAADRADCGDQTAPVVHVGDLVDRGPDSRGVIDWLMRRCAEDARQIVLKGNHDRMFYAFMADPRWQDPGLRAGLSWLDPRLGGAETLATYGISQAGARPLDEVHAEALVRVPTDHLSFLRSLPTSFLHGRALFVHAGVRPGVDLHDQTEDDLVWIRHPFLDHPHDHGALVVHGHTAIDAAQHFGNRLNIDSSVAYGGPLSAVVIEGRDAWLLTGAGRVDLRPAPPDGT
jgi:serine/threonine protein phosphatase 1